MALRGVTQGWIFSPAGDLAVFGGSALLSLLLLAIGVASGLTRATEWSWITGVLLIDVAHVWSTGILAFDPLERRQHPWLWTGIPVVSYLAALGLYACGSAVFWRALAYLAVWHFVRQQWGWLAMYRARAGETDRAGRWLDGLAIHAATLYPLIHWHTHLPRQFDWFLDGDFAALPGIVDRIAFPLYLACMAQYAVRALLRLARGRATWGKDLLVATTALLWWLGIVTFDSDYAFTVTNVFAHGIPYLVFVLWIARQRRVPLMQGRGLRPWLFCLSLLWAVAFCEELLWDRGLWHDRPWLFGAGWTLSDGARLVLVPLLATPQLSHYLLDGFIWRRKHRRA